MVMEEHLVLGLELLSEGARADVPELRDDEFLSDSFPAAADEVHERHKPWTHGDNIQGLGIGRKIVHGHTLDDLALRVYVDEKKASAAVENPVPDRVVLPHVGEVPTDVIEIGVVELQLFKKRVRPAMPGCGVGHPAVTVGTLGLLVKRPDSDQRYILSNSHILANEGDADVGDPILQAGTLDGGRDPEDVIGSLAEWVPFDFTDTGFPNLVDAAIAEVDASAVSDVVRLIGVKPAGVGTEVVRDMKVQKVGRTTDHTFGQVHDVHFRLPMDYKLPDGSGTKGRVGLKDQVLCSLFTGGGDSGAAVLDEHYNLVGLHFAGSSSASVFNKITNVFSALEVELA